jgi:cytochrome c-type biogenesis protein CcmF
MLGKILIYCAFSFALLSTMFYILVHFGKEKFLKLGRFFYHGAALSIISTSIFLLYLILTHQFQYNYIWEHSNTELQLPLLISTFYAGQEGSFMLWTLWTAVLGIFLLSYVSKGERLEPQVMAVYGLILAFLGFILILKSPFKYVWEAFPGEVEQEFVPENGRGLNPLLQNFWMSIHPPTLFIGFSSLAIPFCFAIATLMKNKYDDWIKFSMPWLLFSGMILGLGIMMGGYWAYGVLGWGGYWAWDPVENSSLIPWIVTVACVHTMVAQKRTGGYKKTNIILCILAFLLVLYSTFLTRSGVLGDASVHSFVDPGYEVYVSLIVFISLFIVISIAALLFRFKELRKLDNASKRLLSRESALFLGAVTLCAAALVVFAGTSWPIITKSTVEQDFYNSMNLPIAILIAFINGISLLLKWKNTEEKHFLKNLLFPLILAVIVTVGLVIAGVRDLLIAIFALSAMFAFFVNAEIAFTMFKKDRKASGAYIAHIGIALIFLGVIGSAKYSDTVNLSLELNKPQDAFGYTMTYLGASQFDDPNNRTDTKYYFNVKLEKEGKSVVLQPVMYYSNFTKGILKNPDIANFAVKDLYISPMGLEEEEQFSKEEQIELKKGEHKPFSNFEIEFQDFDFGGVKMGGAEIQSGNFTISAVLKVKDNRFTETISPKIKYTNGNPEYLPAKMSGHDDIEFYLSNVNAQEMKSGSGVITVAVTDKNKKTNKSNTPETLLVAASVKPFINILWTGTGILVIGFFISIIRRRKELYSVRK